jgi:hypothetical protein
MPGLSVVGSKVPVGRTRWAADHTLKVWDLEAGVSLITLSGDSGFTWCTVAPDDRTIVAGDEAGQVHILRLEGFD